MPETGFLRVVRFQPGEAASAFDAELRETLLPRLLDLESVNDVWAGRRGSGDDHDRVIASIWRTDPGEEPDRPPDIAALPALGYQVSTFTVTHYEALPDAGDRRPNPA